jgi:fructokinase
MNGAMKLTAVLFGYKLDTYYIQMIISIGEILFDVFPTYRRLGGAPFNFAFHLQMLGFPVVFVSRVGEDADGDEVRTTIEKYGFDPEDIQIDPSHNTGRVDVQLDAQGVPEFNIRKDVAYDYIDITSKLESHIQNCSLLYYGTLVQRAAHGFKIIQKILSSRPPQLKCFYDVNLRPDCFSSKVLRESLKHADILKLNEEELVLIGKMLGGQHHTEKGINDLRKRFRIEMVALTKGSEGSTLYTDNGRYDAPITQVKNLVDTVGAGDAFASVLVAGYLNQLTPARTLAAASSLAARICSIEGAIPDNRTIYEDIIKQIQKE